ncbi:hypothetical protein [Cohnella sp. GCM10027633]|uniref:hypothetical protein n=1 Tax=unclassified Cohnella TaxID=2636738 RepID=UPI003631522F
MLRYGTRLIAIVTVVAVCGALTACNAGNQTPIAAEPSVLVPHATNLTSPSPEASPHVEPISSPADVPEPSDDVVSNGDGVGAAGAQQPVDSTKGSDKAATEDKPFDPGVPALLGIELHDSDTSVAERFGAATAQYALPGEGETIDMWEYAGFAIGFDERGQVVYIEISSGEVPTGIAGLRTGIPGAEAADVLEIADHPDSHVLTMDVAEGWLKLDLDPDTHEVLSIKLIGIA